MFSIACFYPKPGPHQKHRFYRKNKRSLFLSTEARFYPQLWLIFIHSNLFYLRSLFYLHKARFYPLIVTKQSPVLTGIAASITKQAKLVLSTKAYDGSQPIFPSRLSLPRYDIPTIDFFCIAIIVIDLIGARDGFTASSAIENGRQLSRCTKVPASLQPSSHRWP